MRVKKRKVGVKLIIKINKINYNIIFLFDKYI